MIRLHYNIKVGVIRTHALFVVKLTVTDVAREYVCSSETENPTMFSELNVRFIQFS